MRHRPVRRRCGGAQGRELRNHPSGRVCGRFRPGNGDLLARPSPTPVPIRLVRVNRQADPGPLAPCLWGTGRASKPIPASACQLRTHCQALREGASALHGRKSSPFVHVPVDNSWSRLPQPSSRPAAAVTACSSWNSSRLPATWRQECLDRCEPLLGRKPHASLPIADRPSVHAQPLRQGCLRKSQLLAR